MPNQPRKSELPKRFQNCKSVFKSVRRNNPLKPLQINQETTDVDDEANVIDEPTIKMEDVFDNTIDRLDVLLNISFGNL